MPPKELGQGIWAMSELAQAEPVPAPSARGGIDERLRWFLVRFASGALVWFALWTVSVNFLVLSAARFSALPWCFFATTAATFVLGRQYLPKLLLSYAVPPAPASLTVSSKASMAILLATAVAGALAVHKAAGPLVLAVSVALTSSVAYLTATRGRSATIEAPKNFSIEFAALAILIFALYYFGHRPDWDDAFYVNLASKAPMSNGSILQFDTMLGDGPHPIILPTYRLQSYELLGGTIAYLCGLQPIVVFHLILPVFTLALLASVLALVFPPILGVHWFAASLFSLGFLYANDQSTTSWGMHGLARFHQAKGTLVTTIPLLAVGCTGRWFMRQQWVDAAALVLITICAIGLSATGLFIGPAAIGFAASAFLISNPKRHWTGAAKLLPILFYPALMAIVIVVRRLAYPSEVTEAQQGFTSLMNVMGWHWQGLLLIMLTPMAPLMFRDRSKSRAAAFYLPLALCLVLNPFGWIAVSAISGNLGYRIFWSLPVVFIAGCACVSLLVSLGTPYSERVLGALGIAVLAGGILSNEATAGPEQVVAWHSPDLRVPRPEYNEALSLSVATPSGCKALVPENYAVWLSTQKDAPYLITVRSNYLKQYRFTEPASELRARWKLFNLVNGFETGALPPAEELQSYGMGIGLLAIDLRNRNLPEGARLAQILGLQPVALPGVPLKVWRGPCAHPGQKI